MIEVVRTALADAKQALERLQSDEVCLGRIAAAADLAAAALQGGKRIYSCGNGGSMCDAMHFAEELSGRFRRDRRALAAMAISDPAHLSCVANDFGYEAVFAKFLEAHGARGDILLAISTSGSSANVLAAARQARAAGLPVIALTGRPGSALSELATIDICTPGGSSFADRVQELHIKVIHSLIELIERKLFPDLYK